MGLYPNIHHEEGLKALVDALEKREEKKVPTEFLVEMMRFVLENNIFEFNKKLYIQLIGTAIGTIAAPTLANLFMEVIDGMVEDCGRIGNKNAIALLKRFIDDFLIFWTGTVPEFEEFLEKINRLHPTIKFTASYNFEKRSTTFLDMEVRLVNGKIETDLYRKETDKVQYLLPSSCHPSHIFDNIPYSLALRIIRICSKKGDQEKRLGELEGMLKSRKYNVNIVKAAIEKAKKVGRDNALKKVEKKKSERVTFAIKYHPSLPSLATIVKKHWRTMTKEKRLKNIFPEPPMVAYQQHANLKSLLVRAKLSEGKTQRKTRGMKKCLKGCVVCPYLKDSNKIRSRKTRETVELSNVFNCKTAGVIYMTECQKCGIQYIGQTTRNFNARIREHINDIKNKKDTANANHYNSKGHCLSDFRAIIMERVVPNDTSFLLEREEMWIKRLETKRPHGLNKND